MVLLVAAHNHSFERTSLTGRRSTQTLAARKRQANGSKSNPIQVPFCVRNFNFRAMQQPSQRASLTPSPHVQLVRRAAFAPGRRGKCLVVQVVGRRAAVLSVPRGGWKVCGSALRVASRASSKPRGSRSPKSGRHLEASFAAPFSAPPVSALRRTDLG